MRQGPPTGWSTPSARTGEGQYWLRSSSSAPLVKVSHAWLMVARRRRGESSRRDRRLQSLLGESAEGPPVRGHTRAACGREADRECGSLFLPDLGRDVLPSLDQDIHEGQVEVIRLPGYGSVHMLFVVPAGDFDILGEEIKEGIILDPLVDLALIVEDDIGHDEPREPPRPLVRIRRNRRHRSFLCAFAMLEEVQLPRPLARKLHGISAGPAGGTVPVILAHRLPEALEAEGRQGIGPPA